MNIRNLVKAEVDLPYGASDVSIKLEAGEGAGMPTAPFYATWWNVTDYPDPADDPFAEIVYVTARSVDTLTVTRGADDTVASAKNLNGKSYAFAVTVTAAVVNGKLDAPTEGHAWRTKDGNLQLWNPDGDGGAGAWHSIWLSGTGASVVLNIGPEDTSDFE